MNPLFESLAGLTLRDPWMLSCALLLPLALWLRRRRGAPAVRFAPAAFVQDLPRTWRVRMLPLPPALQVLGLLLVVLALARPVQRTPLPLRTEGIDILLCLDVSSSMAARDMDPLRARLDLAKAAAAQFIAGRPQDRVGLIAFARYPDLVCPPTLDHAALQELLARVERVESEGPEDATGIGTAVARAAQVLRASTAKSKVVILLTDGEENVATAQTPAEIAPLHAGQLCRELGVRVYAIAAGTGGPDASGGGPAIDTSQVQRLAEMTGGALHEARDAGAMAGVYAHIDALEKVEIQEPRYRLEDRFLPFLGAALALLFLGRVLQSTLLEALP
ncbi:MAG: VWA domain-containing protein [Planctomycetota bacterium]|nr:MAG: VWA domain-containing protein [Planctomycetota bacterium]